MNFNPISVIIPTYNRAKTIAYCLDSVINQTLMPEEIIVIDDCSIDDTLQVVKHYNHPLVKIIQLQKNSGAQKARNEGIKAATGEWIAFLDSDDLWMPEYLEKQYMVTLNTKSNIVYCNAFVDNGVSIEKFAMPDVSEDTYKKLLCQTGPMFQGLFIKKSSLEAINYLDEEVVAFQEWDTAIRLAKHNDFVFNVEALFVYNLHEGATISKHKKNNFLGYSYILNKHELEIKKHAGLDVFIAHLKLIQLKYFNIEDWVNWRKTTLKILNNEHITLFQKAFQKVVAYLNPKFYQRFQSNLSPIFILKRIYFVIIKNKQTKNEDYNP